MSIMSPSPERPHGGRTLSGRFLAASLIMVLAVVCVIVGSGDDSSATIGWSYDDGLLKITGSGDMDDYSISDHPPWWTYSDTATELMVPDGITSIGDFAFNGFGSLEAVYLGSGLTDIGTGAFSAMIFYDSDGTTVLPDTAEGLRGCAFARYGVDKYVKQAVEGTGNIGWSFSGGPDGGYLEIFGTGDMDDYATADFQPWGKYRGLITEIKVSDGVTHIGDSAFSFCGHASKVTIAPTVTSIGDDAFSYTTELETIAFPEGLTSIGEYAFRHGGLRSLTVPKVSSIGHGTFMYCVPMESVIIPDTVTDIGAEAFLGCMNLDNLYVSNGLMTVAADSFTDVNLLDSDTTPLEKDVAHLKGAMFVAGSGGAVKLATDIVVDGSVCSKASDTHSASLTLEDMIYIKKRASFDDGTVLQFLLKDGIKAVFDGKAIATLGEAAIELTIAPVDKSAVSVAVRDLIGDNDAYSVSFGGNTDLGEGKATITVPYAGDGDTAKVSLVKGESVSSTISCTCADGKATFETNDLTMFFIESESSPGGGSEFPIWIPIVIVVVLLAAAGAVFLLMRKGRY